MTPGRSRTAASVELTREGTNRDPADTSAISAAALSPDGHWAAITTARTRFLLPVLRLVDAPTTVPGLEELYLINLDTGNVERGLRGASGANADGGVVPALSLSDGGRRVAFATSADNLFFGDANQRTDVFVIDRLDAPPPVPDDPEPPSEPVTEPFDTPAPPRRSCGSQCARRRAGGCACRCARRARASSRSRCADACPTTTAACAGRRGCSARSKTVKKAGTVTLEIKLAKRYVTVARREKKLDGRATVTFKPDSGASLTGATSVRFGAPPRRK